MGRLSRLRVLDEADAPLTAAGEIEAERGHARAAEERNPISMRYLYLVVVTLVLAACTSTAVATPTPSPEPPAVSSPTPAAPDEAEAATITLGDFGIADGPGESIVSAIANAGAEPRLVNGTMLKEADGTVWLCEAVSDSSPRECDEPRLLVTNYPEDHVVVDGEDYYSVFARDQPGIVDLQEEDGVRWVEEQQLFGIVRAGS